jgi:hypothetical protein
VPGLHWVFVRAHSPCAACGAETTRHLAASLPCVGCGAEQPGLSGAELEALAVGLGAHDPGTQVLPVGHSEILISPAQPRCAACGEAFVGPLEASTLVCGGCGATARVEEAPAGVRARVPGAARVLRPTAGASKEEPIWLSCPRCAGALRVDAEASPVVRCAGCSARVAVPEEVWEALLPARRRRGEYLGRWSLAPQARRAARQRRRRVESASAALRFGSEDPADHLAVLSDAGDDHREAALEHPEFAWFEAAVDSLAESAGWAPLRRRLVLEDEPQRALCLALALEAQDPALCARTYVRLLHRAGARLAHDAVGGLRRCGGPEALKALRELARDGLGDLPAAAAAGLLEMDASLADWPPGASRVLAGPRRTARALAHLTWPGSARQVRRALTALLAGGAEARAVGLALLPQRPEREARPPLEAAALRPGHPARVQAIRALQTLGWRPQTPTLWPHFGEDERVFRAAAAASAVDRESALCALLQADGPVAVAAAETLGAHGRSPAISTLRELASGWFVDRSLRQAAEAAARAIELRAEHGGLSVADDGAGEP